MQREPLTLADVAFALAWGTALGTLLAAFV